ncbi:MAG: hypothetical protein PHU65_00165 [Actinomycetota bacterium]|nr:hypothetical protein [Actinomycetota bacterium]
MDKKTIVEILGIPEQNAGSGGCNCSCGGYGCASIRTDELYKELEDFINGSDVKDLTELNFIDIEKADLEKYGNVKKAIDIGYPLPLTLINGEIVFFGDVTGAVLYNEIKKLNKE